MPKVYAPQIPSKYDPATRLWVPSINLDPAKKFGEISVMLPPNANRLHIRPLVDALKEQLKNFTEEDYIIAVGDPSLIAAAVCIATKKTNGFMRLLKWDRQMSEYLEVETYI